MKMTKIESARIIAKQKSCFDVVCSDCFLDVQVSCDDKVNRAKAYIKRHEQKCKKRLIPTKYTPDIQPDMTNAECKRVVTLPKDNPTPLDIAKAIRDNGYRCVGLTEVECKDCPLCDYNCGSGIKTNVNLRSKQLIDDYIKANEPVCEHLVGDLCGNAFENCDKECLANSELKKPEPVIEPIKFDDPVPEYVYWTEDSRIERVASASFYATKERDNINAFVKDVVGRTYNLENCYKTLDDAVAVAKKNWGLK